MKLSEENLNRVISLTTATRWNNGLPEVSAALRVAVNEFVQCMDEQTLASEMALERAIQGCKVCREVVTRDGVTTESFAFALRDALLWR